MPDAGHEERRMQLREMAEALERLESTSSRRRMVEQVAEMLQRAGRDELAPLGYLLQGQLRPPFEGIEIGAGEKLLVQVLADAYATSTATITRRLKQLGDLGLVAASLAPAAP